MTPRWESPLERSSSRDAALLAEVMGSLERQLTEGLSEASQNPDDPARADGAAEGLEDLISAAVAELQRLDTLRRPEGGIAPVLGAGVVQELLRRGRSATLEPDPDAPRTFDHRL
jgi:hypothetical protein